MTTWTGKRILFLAGMFEVPEKSLYIKSEMDTTKFFKENLKIFLSKSYIYLKKYTITRSICTVVHFTAAGSIVSVFKGYSLFPFSIAQNET